MGCLTGPAINSSPVVWFKEKELKKILERRSLNDSLMAPARSMSRSRSVMFCRALPLQSMDHRPTRCSKYAASLFIMNFIPEKYRKNWVHFDVRMSSYNNAINIADRGTTEAFGEPSSHC